MESLIEMVASGRVFTLVLGVLCIEALLLMALAARASIPRASQIELLVNLLAGASLLAAAIFALASMSWIWIALALAAAGLAHVYELTRRLARARAKSPLSLSYGSGL